MPSLESGAMPTLDGDEDVLQSMEGTVTMQSTSVPN